MTYFGWLDGDDSQRAAMLEVVKLFEDSSTVDELGLGTIRDTFSNHLFPGTSTLHTRVKYMLFVGWLVSEVARHRWTPEAATRELRRQETHLITALIAGGEREGVIGRDAGAALKRMPSELYWPSLVHLGICTWNTSIAGYFRRAGQQRPTGEAGSWPSGTLRLPPIEVDLLDHATFSLDLEQAEYLRTRISQSAKGSLLAWLVTHHPISDEETLWRHEALGDLPTDLKTAVDDGRRFSVSTAGTALLYNLMLAEATGSDELVTQFSEALTEWQDELEDEGVFKDWDPRAFWARLYAKNRRIRPATRDFVDTWWSLASTDDITSTRARELIRLRELRLKRGRARLTYPDARATWSPGAGTVRLEYRWPIARRHLNDIGAGLVA